MIHFVKFAIVFLIFSSANAQNAGAPARSEGGITLTIVLENVLNDQGDILAGLHTRQTFMKGAGINNYKGKATSGEHVFIFKNVQPGEYAVSVLHDLNSNAKMDFEVNGMPKEPYAMSGNDMAMGPPVFGSCDFEVGAEDMELRLRF